MDSAVGRCDLCVKCLVGAQISGNDEYDFLAAAELRELGGPRQLDEGAPARCEQLDAGLMAFPGHHDGKLQGVAGGGTLQSEPKDAATPTQLGRQGRDKVRIEGARGHCGRSGNGVRGVQYPDGQGRRIRRIR